MTKKDYKLIADVLKEAAIRTQRQPSKDAENETRKIFFYDLVDMLCYKLKEDNTRFDISTFRERIGWNLFHVNM